MINLTAKEQVMTLPALPLYQGPTLSNHSMILLALLWLRGGSVTDYIDLDVSESVLLSMLLEAARGMTPTCRFLRELDANSKGFREGMEKGREIYGP